MQTRERAASSTEQPITLPRPHGRARLSLLGGGTDGNEQLTAVTGAVLVLLLAVIGITILRVQQLISVHLFVGLLLIGPVALKLASTGYRFVRYYMRNPAYAHKGPPEPIMRMIAPVVVVSTIAVFVTGLLLLFGGASSRDSYLGLHKVTFIVWIAFTGLHVLGHLPGLTSSLRAASRGDDPHGGRSATRNGSAVRNGSAAMRNGNREARGSMGIVSSPGEAGRWLVLAGALVGGLVLAIALIPDYHSWQHASAALQGHDG